MDRLATLATAARLRTKPTLQAASACARLCEELGIRPLAADLDHNVHGLTAVAVDAPQDTTTLATLLAHGGATARMHLYWLHRDLATIACYVRRRREHGDSSADALSHAYDTWLAPIHTLAMRAAFHVARKLIAPTDAAVDAAIASHAHLDLGEIERALDRIVLLVPTQHG